MSNIQESSESLSARAHRQNRSQTSRLKVLDHHHQQSGNGNWRIRAAAFTRAASKPLLAGEPLVLPDTFVALTAAVQWMLSLDRKLLADGCSSVVGRVVDDAKFSGDLKKAYFDQVEGVEDVLIHVGVEDRLALVAGLNVCVPHQTR
eukprot:3840762-Pleurochrysis_carterae.AAC.2